MQYRQIFHDISKSNIIELIVVLTKKRKTAIQVNVLMSKVNDQNQGQQHEALSNIIQSRQNKLHLMSLFKEKYLRQMHRCCHVYSPPFICTGWRGTKIIFFIIGIHMPIRITQKIIFLVALKIPAIIVIVFRGIFSV